MLWKKGKKRSFRKFLRRGLGNRQKTQRSMTKSHPIFLLKSVLKGVRNVYQTILYKDCKYRKNVTIYGSTSYKKKLSSNYINIELKKKILRSQSKDYVSKFLEIQKNTNPDIIEIHNRPIYVEQLVQLKTNLVLYFHNDPITMIGSKSVNERVNLLTICSKIIFNSEWSKKQFLKNLKSFYHKSKKLEVIHQSTNKTKVDLNKKENLITFVGSNHAQCAWLCSLLARHEASMAVGWIDHRRSACMSFALKKT